MARTRLPNRRPSVIDEIEWLGQRWPVCFGFDAEGRIREAFCKGSKSGADIEGLLDDACILLSILLQHGTTVAEIEQHLGREGIVPGSRAASPIGEIARLGARIEAELAA